MPANAVNVYVRSLKGASRSQLWTLRTLSFRKITLSSFATSTIRLREAGSHFWVAAYRSSASAFGIPVQGTAEI